MIRLTKFSGTDVYVNIDQIAQIEETPDVVVTLESGNKLVVLDSAEIIIEKIVCFKAKVMRRALLSSDSDDAGIEAYRPVCELGITTRNGE